MNQRRILVVVNDDWFFLLHRSPAAKRLREQGFEIVVSARDTGRAGEIRAEGFVFEPLKIRKASLNPLHDVRLFVQLVGIMRRTKPGAVHLMTLKPVIFGLLAARVTRVRAAVASFYGRGIIYSGTGLRYRILKLVLTGLLRMAAAVAPKTTVWTAEHETDARFFRKAIGRRHAMVAVLVGAGYDASRFKPSPEPPGPLRVLYAGRLLYGKGLSDLVDATRMVLERGTPVKLVIAGIADPTNPDAIPADVLDTWFSRPEVEWLGRRDDVDQLMAQAHIVALPTRYLEGVPRLLVEAAASERAIIATDVAGCREVVVDGETGLLIPAHDPEALARSIARLAADPVLRKRLARGAAERAVSHFSREREVRDLASVYGALFAPARANRDLDALLLSP